MSGGSSVMNGEASDTADRVALLGTVPILAGLSEEDLTAVAAVSISRYLPRG